MSYIPSGHLMLEFALQHLHHVVIWPKSPSMTRNTVCLKEIHFMLRLLYSPSWLKLNGYLQHPQQLVLILPVWWWIIITHLCSVSIKDLPVPIRKYLYHQHCTLPTGLSWTFQSVCECSVKWEIWNNALWTILLITMLKTNYYLI